MVTDIKRTEQDTGLRILARMIARAHLKAACSGQLAAADSQERSSEGDNGKQKDI